MPLDDKIVHGKDKRELSMQSTERKKNIKNWNNYFASTFLNIKDTFKALSILIYQL